MRGVMRAKKETPKRVGGAALVKLTNSSRGGFFGSVVVLGCPPLPSP